jgi:hypothetical protein
MVNTSRVGNYFLELSLGHSSCRMNGSASGINSDCRRSHKKQPALHPSPERLNIARTISPV